MLIVREKNAEIFVKIFFENIKTQCLHCSDDDSQSRKHLNRIKLLPVHPHHSFIIISQQKRIEKNDNNFFQSEKIPFAFVDRFIIVNFVFVQGARELSPYVQRLNLNRRRKKKRKIRKIKIDEANENKFSVSCIECNK